MDDYARGQREALRLALAVFAAEEAKWAALLGESSSWRTNATREVRRKTLQVAQTRLYTALNRITPKGDASIAADEMTAALKKYGLWRRFTAACFAPLSSGQAWSAGSTLAEALRLVGSCRAPSRPVAAALCQRGPPPRHRGPLPHRE
jgi:hypothetical protein